MPDIRPFRGVFYADQRDISRKISPPYDVLTERDIVSYRKMDKHNVVRLILNKGDTINGTRLNGYDASSFYFSNWQRQGILRKDEQPGIYLYEQRFNYNSKDYRRIGFMSAVKLEEFGSNKVFPHENTFTGPIEDRLKLTIATRANLCPIFSLFPDRDKRIMTLLLKSEKKQMAVAKDRNGVIHTLYRINNTKSIDSVRKALFDKPFFIADGHHRYTSALKYRERMRSISQTGNTEKPSDFVMMYLCPMESLDLLILPIYRLVKFHRKVDVQKILISAEKYFKISKTSSMNRGIEAIEHTPKGRNVFCLRFKKDKTVYILELKNRDVMKRLNKDNFGEERLFLDVSVLHMLFIGDILGMNHNVAEKNIRYSHNSRDLMTTMREGWGDCIVLLKSPTVDQIQAVTSNGDKMPHKSTFFYPKLYSGMLFRSLVE